MGQQSTPLDKPLTGGGGTPKANNATPPPPPPKDNGVQFSTKHTVTTPPTPPQQPQATKNTTVTTTDQPPHTTVDDAAVTVDNYDAHVVVDSQTPEEQPAVEEVSDGVFVFRIGEKERERYRAETEQRLKLNADNINWSELHEKGEPELERVPIIVLKKYLERVRKNHNMESKRNEEKKAKYGNSTPVTLNWANRVAVIDRVITKLKNNEFKKQAEEGIKKR